MRKSAWACGALLLAFGAGASGADEAVPEIGYKKPIGEDEGARNPNNTPNVEAYLIRAYPASEVPGEATVAARQGWAALGRSSSAASWQLIGPSKATYPSVLNPFLFDGAQYVTSGRVTALAISSRCRPGDCALYVGAAGGGVWKTPDALAGSPSWQYMSASFGTNAIGSLLIDPRDASGNTVYAGTGEPNASADSEAGVGIYKSNDGGANWSLVPGSAIFFQRAVGQMALDGAGNLLVPVASAVRGIASTGGGSSSGSTLFPLVTRGLYRQSGTTFTLIRASTPVRGSTTVKVDPTHAGVLYVNDYGAGIWRSKDNGATWAQIKTALAPGLSTDRAEFDINTLADGRTRMYVGVGNQTDAGANRARVYVTDDASGAATFVDRTSPQNIGYCTGQCWYDNVVYSPAGAPDTVYLGGSFSYDELHGPSNGRAWLLSSDAALTFTDITQDGDPHRAEGMHPDQHAIVTVPGNPRQFIVGSDGGVVRSDGRVADISYKCAGRAMAADDTAYCQSLLRRVPNQLVNMNNGLSTLQFQSLSMSTQRPKNLLMGGTQDNGTFQFNGSPVLWPQVIYGDGGQSGFNTLDDSLRFNTFTGQAHDANFRKGDPEKWVIVSAPIISSPEGSLFYPPIIADPSTAAAGSIFQGSFSVWRTQDWGGDPAYLEANCPEFTTSAAKPGCGNFVRIGNGAPSTQLTDAAWGSKAGGAVSALTRAAQDVGTLWAATSTGRVFVSPNANAAADAVVWSRLDGGSTVPNRFVTSIAVDGADAAHAWVSVSGYNINTPGQPGHVFEVFWTGGAAATWFDRSFNLPDFPITAVVRDDVTGDLYASSDFGVMKLPSGSTSWVVAGAGLPMVEVSGLTISSSARILYAATHGRSAWSLQLP